MKDALRKLLTGNFPRLKAALTAGIVGGLTWLITRVGLNVGPDWSAQITSMATLAAGWLLESIAAKMGSDGIKAIQDVLPGVASTGSARKDGTTVEAVRELVADTTAPQPVLSPTAKTVKLMEKK